VYIICIGFYLFLSSDNKIDYDCRRESEEIIFRENKQTYKHGHLPYYNIIIAVWNNSKASRRREETKCFKIIKTCTSGLITCKTYNHIIKYYYCNRRRTDYVVVQSPRLLVYRMRPGWDFRVRRSGGRRPVRSRRGQHYSGKLGWCPQGVRCARHPTARFSVLAVRPVDRSADGQSRVAGVHW